MKTRTLAALPLVGLATGGSLALAASPASADSHSGTCPAIVTLWGTNEVEAWAPSVNNLPAGKTCYLRAHQICQNGQEHWSPYTGYKVAGIISVSGCTASNPTVYGGYDSFYK